MITLGQYLQPTEFHLPVVRYVSPDEFESLKVDRLKDWGLGSVASGPMVRSSYHADLQAQGESYYMNQPLQVNLTKELLELENFIIHRSCDVEQWFRSQWLENQAPFYGSVDLRNSGFKLAPVDMNLFPGGFNNLNPDFAPLAIQACFGCYRKSLPRSKESSNNSRKTYKKYVLFKKFISI